MILDHLKGSRILVFAGHVNKDSGATAFAKDGETRYSTEAEVNLDIALSLVHDLRQHSNHECQAFLGHGSWKRRSRLAYLYKPDVILDIHCNAFDDPEVRGYEVWHAGDQPSESLAGHIINSLAMGNPIPSRGTKNVYDENNPRCALWEKIPERPCVLVECGFLTNAIDAALLTSMPFQDLTAIKIALGLNQYFTPTPSAEDSGAGGGYEE